MGGYGSSRWMNHVRKNTIEECVLLNLGQLIRSGLFLNPTPQSLFAAPVTSHSRLSIRFLFEQGPSLTRHVTLFLSLQDSGQTAEFQQRIPITTIPWAGGRFREFFTCPGLTETCGRHCVRVYLPPGSLKFACRQCHDLTYLTCRACHDLDFLVRGSMPPELKQRLIRMFRVKRRMAQLRRARLRS
jgi:hypothetical protein